MLTPYLVREYLHVFLDRACLEEAATHHCLTHALQAIEVTSSFFRVPAGRL